MSAASKAWPALDHEECRPTWTTLHRYSQVVGKVQLALTPSLPHWEQAPLRLTARGLVTQLLWTGDRALSIYLDLTGHELRLDLSDAGRRILSLGSGTIADFYDKVTEALDELDVSVTIDPMTVMLPEPVSCATDTTHGVYDQRCVRSLMQVFTTAGAVLDDFRAGFSGHQTPAGLYWGGFDLSVTRYSGRAAGPPLEAGPIERAAMDAQQSTAGFWVGDDHAPEPVFFSSMYPEPAGLATAAVRPAAAVWNADAGQFLLPYDAVRRTDDARAALLEFFQSTFAAGAELGGWDRAARERRPHIQRAV